MEDMGLRVTVAVLVTTGLLALLVIGLRMFGAKFGIVAGTGGGQARLSILETKYLDSRHRACIIARDGEVEHLVILGGAQPVVVETIRSGKKS